MKRNKYINTFNTTTDFDNYINSGEPGFPNVALTKDNETVHYTPTSPNSHVWYGEVVDPSGALPTIYLNNTVNTPTLDTLNNTFYLDSWTNTSPISISISNRSNIKLIKKWTGLDTSNAGMIGMFNNCSSLTSVDLSNFNTSNVINMSTMFNNCSSLTSLDLSNFNTSNVTDMNGMFYTCSSLTSLDLSNFNTSNVTDMHHMFRDCTSLTSLDLSNFNTSNVTNMNGMFRACNALTDVYINVEATLMKLTNNLSSQSSDYIPSNNSKCTIHYNGTDYKWQNNAWTPQS